jgi:hypothetical protein
MQYRSADSATATPSRWLHWALGTSIFMATLTGFGQMPIFKRYYIADIPGLGWLAQCYVTRFMHYFFGMLLLGFIGYRFTGWLLAGGAKGRLTVLAKGRGAVLGGILLTGVLLALKNFTGYLYPPAVIIALDLIHLGLVMIWLVLSIASFGFAR